MKRRNSILCVVAGLLAGAAVVCAQQPAGNQPAQNQDKQKPAQSGSGGNPFPGDTTTVPVLPNANTQGQPAAVAPDSGAGIALPARDADPARSPDEGEPAITTSSSSGESSSSVADMDKLLPKDDEDTKRRKDAPEFHETAAGDIDVGNFELDRHNWKGALSRFQSAMVLDPENPDAFWGMAEAARHLGDFASARSYYQKVYDYDPDSKHGKEARKALKDPEIANAQSAASSQPAKK